MKRNTLAALIGAFVLSVAGSAGRLLADEVHGFDAGEPGKAEITARPVEVTMKDRQGMAFDPATIQAKTGEQLRFMIVNAGEGDHEFFLGSPAEVAEHEKMMAKMPDMGAMEANAVRLTPGAKAELLWRFTRPGEFEYACLLPGHREAGMTGKIIVKD